MISVINKIERFNITLGAIGGIATLLMLFAVIPDILARGVFRVALHGVAESCTALLVIMVFIGFAGAQAQDAHFRISVLDTLMPNSLALFLIRLIGILLSIAIFALASGLSWHSAVRAFVQGEMELGMVAFPVWPQRFVVWLGFFLLTVQLVLDLLRLLAGAERSSVPSPEGH